MVTSVKTLYEFVNTVSNEFVKFLYNVAVDTSGPFAALSP